MHCVLTIYSFRELSHRRLGCTLTTVSSNMPPSVTRLHRFRLRFHIRFCNSSEISGSCGSVYVITVVWDTAQCSLVEGAGAALSVYCLTTSWTNGIRSPAKAKGFSSSHCIQTSSEAHPASYPICIGGPFQGVKLGRGVTLTVYPIQCRSQK
jgi:hypothetical protein